MDARSTYDRIIAEIEDNAKFPRTCNAVRYYKEGRGQDGMCRVVEEYAREYAEEKAIETAESLISDGVSDDIIHNATKLPLEKIAELREKHSA